MDLVDTVVMLDAGLKLVLLSESPTLYADCSYQNFMCFNILFMSRL